MSYYTLFMYFLHTWKDENIYNFKDVILLHESSNSIENQVEKILNSKENTKIQENKKK